MKQQIPPLASPGRDDRMTLGMTMVLSSVGMTVSALQCAE